MSDCRRKGADAKLGGEGKKEEGMEEDDGGRGGVERQTDRQTETEDDASEWEFSLDRILLQIFKHT
jgi:hypothetical protein